ncbi:hypothetical protein AALP_AAs52007U000500 [Arabis alpina]|uniref:Uncharacterized protein n=1 Tax=Arabis alpina TaxID=50452 RepID=A0A087G2D2_ARAAL|nr:hypothetical protein AALP_AAs52007U000500 [Arabis alpina]
MLCIRTNKSKPLSGCKTSQNQTLDLFLHFSDLPLRWPDYLTATVRRPPFPLFAFSFSLFSLFCQIRSRSNVSRVV